VVWGWGWVCVVGAVGFYVVGKEILVGYRILLVGEVGDFGLFFELDAFGRNGF
jgi:hypothetical protein